MNSVASSARPSRRGGDSIRREWRAEALRWAACVAVLAGVSLSACRPENTHYSAVSILCADAMRIHLKGQNVAKILRFSERDEGMRSQILFELTDFDGARRQAAASCAFARDEKNRMLLVGSSLNGHALDAAEIAQLADLLLRGTR